jgi:hypothetical protein
LAEFEGKFAEVLDMSEVFRKIAKSDRNDLNAADLNEVEFLRFLTTQGRTMTRDQMRKTFASVDFDKSGGVAFIEWLLFRYEKTVRMLQLVVGFVCVSSACFSGGRLVRASRSSSGGWFLFVFEFLFKTRCCFVSGRASRRAQSDDGRVSTGHGSGTRLHRQG